MCSGIGLMMVFFGSIPTTAPWESNMVELPKDFHQAVIFNAPGDPGLRVEPFQRVENVSAKRAWRQSVQHRSDGNGYDEHGNNQPFVIIGFVLYFLAFSLRKRSGSSVPDLTNTFFRQETPLSSKCFLVKRNSIPDFGDIGLLRSSLSQEFQSLQAPFLAIGDSVDAAKERIKEGIETAGEPTQNSAAIVAALGDIEKAANGVVAITQEGIESVKRAADSAETRERMRMLAGAIGGAAIAATEIIASRQLRLVSINSAASAVENGGRGRLLAETVARANPMPRSWP
jgi:hypothetical protein